MRKSLLATASIAGLTLCASFGAHAAGQAAILIPVPLVSGAVNQTVFGINDSNIVAGSFHDSAGIEHGFFGPLDGSNYTTFDISGQGVIGTEPRAIANDGSIPGFAPSSGFSIGEEFFRTAGGSIVFPMHDGHTLDGVLQGTNINDTSLGDYFDATGTRVGYFAQNGHFLKNFRLHIAAPIQTSPRKVEDDGHTFAGYFIDANDSEHGFTQHSSTTQVIDYPAANAILTVLEDINDRQNASGQWDDSSGNPHAFWLDTKTSTFKDIKIHDGGTFQQAWGLNSNNLVAVSSSTGTSYIWCAHIASKCPSGGAEVKVNTIHVAPGTFLKYDRYGRTSHKLPPVGSIKTHGLIQ